MPSHTHTFNIDKEVTAALKALRKAKDKIVAPDKTKYFPFYALSYWQDFIQTHIDMLASIPSSIDVVVSDLEGAMHSHIKNLQEQEVLDLEDDDDDLADEIKDMPSKEAYRLGRLYMMADLVADIESRSKS